MFRDRTCKRTRQRMSEYLDSLLTPSERGAVAIHVSQCEECRIYLHSLETAVDALHRLPSVALPRGFAVMRQPSPQPLRLFAPLRLATAMAAVLLALVFTAHHVGLPYLTSVPQAAERQAVQSDIERLAALATEQAKTLPRLEGVPREAPETRAATGDSAGFVPIPTIGTEGTNLEPGDVRYSRATSPTDRSPIQQIEFWEALLVLLVLALGISTGVRWRVERMR